MFISLSDLEEMELATEQGNKRIIMQQKVPPVDVAARKENEWEG